MKGYIAISKDTFRQAIKCKAIDPQRCFALAAELGDAATIRVLHSLGQRLGPDDHEILQRPARLGYTHAVKALLRAGAGASPRGEQSGALHAAAGGGYTAIVKALLAAGANVNADDSAALRSASYHGHVATVRALLDAGADARACSGEVLRLVIQNGHGEIAAALKAAGARTRSRPKLSEECHPYPQPSLCGRL